MLNFDYITKKEIKKHNPNWSEIPDHPCRILTVGGSVSRKANAILNLINHEPDIDKIYLCAKDSYEAKYQLLINKKESSGSIKMILKLLLNSQMKWMIFVKILKNTIQIKNEKYWSYLMIWLLICLVIKKLIQ